MSLLENAMEKFTVINKITEPDGYGGTITRWVDGAQIQGAMVYDGSAQMLAAQAAGATSMYTLTVKKNVMLDFHDVVRRESDGKIFRLKTNSDDMKTPDSAQLNMRQYQAEEWRLTS